MSEDDTFVIMDKNMVNTELNRVEFNVAAEIEKMDLMLKTVNDINRRLTVVENNIIECNNKVDTMVEILNKMNDKIVEKNSRDINRTIRKFAKDKTSYTGFVPSSTHFGSIFRPRI